MEVNPIDAELEIAIARTAKKTSSYLKAVAKYAIENDLPLCLSSAWSSKAKGLISNSTAELRSDVASCAVCGLDLRNKRCFDVKINASNEVRHIQGVCCGCRQVYECGVEQLPSCSNASQDSESTTDLSSVETTFDENSICAASTPFKRPKAPLLISPKVTSSQDKGKRNRKRRGSALERLLKEDDSEMDRSLSGFLSMVAKH
ncbi:unnamed protein product [Cylicocyclus nassatus]|uniref:Uncharacterized protein n=1 Tax=Cylicocyclus nassatus TaxID=53992 RepID=A0AA36H4P4_CYLNA|nr:unnamed protein product [Cylicocyclus nassatus]